MQDFILILPNIRSQFNVGSIFRTADAVGVSKIYLTGYTPRPDRNDKISKTALGSEKTIAWEYKYDTWRVIEDLKKKGYQIVALEQSNKSINYLKFKPKFPIALILGNEVKGLSKSLLNRCDKIIHLPMIGKKESLNVGVAFGVIGYYLRFKK